MAVPFATPVTVPLVLPTVATPVLLLLHTPPPASVSDVNEPAHTAAVPLIAEGDVFTDMLFVAMQPVESA